MKKRAIAWLIVLAMCISAVPALAANVFLFTEKVINIFEGETYQTTVRREGNYSGDAEIVYTTGKSSVATISADGLVTAIGKGRTEITASLMRNGKRVGQNKATVNVLRAVNKVTLNTGKLSVYDPDDPAVVSQLREPTELRVLVMPAGSTAVLTATCTPEDASNKKTAFTTTDAGVAKVQGTNLRAVQRGECDLIISSVQNPEVTERLRVLVIQPVKSIQIDAGGRKVAAGSTLQLTAACLPNNASIQGVTWTSKTPKIASVDENGLVTGLARGSASIAATAKDGSNTTQTVQIQVTQPVTSISVTTPEVLVTTGRTATAKALARPADATDKTLTWSSSDPSIATVRGNGQVTGVRAGTCTLIATSNSNPEVYATATVVVSQLVTAITNVNDPAELSFRVGESLQTRWTIQPADSTNTTLTFKSNSNKVATVDANGVVTGTGRGKVTITATSKDAGRKSGTVKVEVIQPVTGVKIAKPRYYIQLGYNPSIRAEIQPKNANNQKVYWTSLNEYVASVISNGTNTGRVSGITSGTTLVTAYTEDGGFTASTEIRVGQWNSAVLIEDLRVDETNRIRIVLRNMTPDVTMSKIRYFIYCYDTDGNPFVCNQDGESLYFEGSYRYLLGPYEQTIHGNFDFGNYKIDRELGAVILKVVSWTDDDGVQYTIPDDQSPQRQWTKFINMNPGEGVG